MHPSPDTPRVHSSQIDLDIIRQERGVSLTDYSYNGGVPPEPSGEQYQINIYLNSGSGIDFETIRKVLIVGVPSTFNDRGGTAQLFWVSKAQGPNKCPYPLTFILRAFACELQLTM